MDGYDRVVRLGVRFPRPGDLANRGIFQVADAIERELAQQGFEFHTMREWSNTSLVDEFATVTFKLDETAMTQPQIDWLQLFKMVANHPQT